VLEITADHMLFKYSDPTDAKKVVLVRAGDVKVGDLLVAPQAIAKVTSISKVERQGLYAPFTGTGSIMVDGVVASSKISLPEAFQAILSYEQQQWLQHTALLPHRLICGESGCKNETYDEETGLAKAVLMCWLPLLHMFEWILLDMASIGAVAV